MSSQEIIAGKAVVEVGTRVAIQKGLQAAEATLKKFGARVGQIGSAATMAGGALAASSAAVLGSLAAAAKSFADAGSALDDMAQRTGATVEGLGRLSYAAKMSGTSIETVEGGIRKAQKAIVEAEGGSKSLAAAFQQLGLNTAQLLRQSPEVQFQTIAAAIGRIENPTTRAAMAMQIFGKSGTELLPLMRSDIGELADEAERLGLVMSGESASAAAALGDAIDKASDVIAAAWARIGGALAPVLTAMLDRVVEVVGVFNNWVGRNQAVVVGIAGIATVVGAAGVALVTFGGVAIATSSLLTALGTIAGVASTVIGFFSAAMAGATTITGAFGAVLNAALAPLWAVVGVVGLVVAGIVALIAAWGAAVAFVAGQAGLLGEALDWVSTRFFALLNTVTQTMGGVLSALGAGQYVLAAQILWAGLKLAFLQGADACLEAVGGLFTNALSIVNRFNMKLAELIYRGFLALPKLMHAALTGGSIVEVMQSLLTNGLDVGGILDNQVASAQSELDGLLARLPKPEASAAAGGAVPVGSPRIMPPAAANQAATAAAIAAATPPPATTRGPDTLESLRAEREAHERRSYASGAAFDAAELDLRRRELAYRQQKMLEAAKAQAAAKTAEKLPASKLPATPEVKALESAPSAAAQQMAKTSAVGTFSAAAVGAIAAGAGDDRVANNTASLVGLTRRMLRQRQRGPVYS